MHALQWNMLVGKYNLNQVFRQETFGVFLECDKSLLTGRKCKVKATFILVNHAGLKNRTKTISHTYTEQAYYRGEKYFISFNELIDPRYGYVKDNEIVVEIHMDVLEPEAL